MHVVADFSSLEYDYSLVTFCINWAQILQKFLAAWAVGGLGT